MTKIGADLASPRPMENAQNLREDQVMEVIEMIN